MDWLLSRQDAIEKKLAARHLETGGLAYSICHQRGWKGIAARWARSGIPRDGKKSREQIEFGMVTSRAGVSIQGAAE